MRKQKLSLSNDEIESIKKDLNKTKPFFDLVETKEWNDVYKATKELLYGRLVPNQDYLMSCYGIKHALEFIKNQHSRYKELSESLLNN